MKKNYLNIIIYTLSVVIIGLIIYLFAWGNKEELNSISLNKNKIELFIGENEILKTTIVPNDISVKLNWSSNNDSIATVDKFGKVEALEEGVTVVTVTEDKTKKSDSCEVIVSVKVTPTPVPTPTPEPTPVVTPIPVKSISLNKTNVIMAVGASDELKATIEPSDAFDKGINWSSSNNSVVTVSKDGKIKALASGTSTITVTTNDGNKTATCNVSVINRTTFDQRNDAVVNYLKNPSSSTITSTYKTYKCGDGNCMRPRYYYTNLIGKINIYRYSLTDNSKKIITTCNSNEINYYLIPNTTYYLESQTDKTKVEIVTITGDLRMVGVDKIDNMRDLGGYNADGGKVRYGRIFRSARPDLVPSLVPVKALAIAKVVDLRKTSEIQKYGSNSLLKNIRQQISVNTYSINKNDYIWDAVNEIMKTVVANQNVLFHCQVGRDRTGTVAYMLEGILGIPINERHIDYELSYYHSKAYTRSNGAYQGLINKVNKYGMTTYEQERFINWFLDLSSNKETALELINNFRKKMIDGNPHNYKLSNEVLVLSQ